MESSAMKKKASKPAIEKRRRARINDSVTQLAEMVMTPDILNQNRPVRLQKSHILEKAVDYIRNIKQREYKSAEKNFQDGYRYCMTEVQNFFSTNKDTDDSVGEELKRFLVHRMGCHLQERWTSRQTLSSNNYIVDLNFPLSSSDSEGDHNNNGNNQTAFSMDVETMRSSSEGLNSCSDSNGSNDYSGGASCSSEDEPMEEVGNCDNDGSPLWRPW